MPRNDLKEAQKSFLAVLGKHVPTEPQTPAEQSRETAEQLVSLSMIQPMLKQLRETNNAAPPFAPTQAEKQFRALTDADLAQRIVKAKHFPLVDRVAQVLLKRSDKLASGESVADAIAGATAASPMSPPAIDLKGKAP